jgi:hypothetical protein
VSIAEVESCRQASSLRLSKNERVSDPAGAPGQECHFILFRRFLMLLNMSSTIVESRALVNALNSDVPPLGGGALHRV